MLGIAVYRKTAEWTNSAPAIPIAAEAEAFNNLYLLSLRAISSASICCNTLSAPP